MNPRDIEKGLYFGHMGRRYKDTHLHTISLRQKKRKKKQMKQTPPNKSPKIDSSCHPITNTRRGKQRAAKQATHPESRQSERYLGTEMDESINSSPPTGRGTHDHPNRMEKMTASTDTIT